MWVLLQKKKEKDILLLLSVLGFLGDPIWVICSLFCIPSCDYVFEKLIFVKLFCCKTLKPINKIKIYKKVNFLNRNEQDGPIILHKKLF